MADSIKNMSPNIIMPKGTEENIFRLDIPAADILNRSGVMHAGITSSLRGYKVSRYNVCKHQVVFVVSGKLYFQNVEDAVCVAKAGEKVVMPISYQQHYWLQGKAEFCWFHLHSIGLWKKLDSAVIGAGKSSWIEEICSSVRGYIREGKQRVS